MERRNIVIAALLIGAGLLLLWPRSKVSEEDRIRAVLHACTQAAGQRRPSGITEHVSTRYAGEGGSRDELRSYLAGFLLRADWAAALETGTTVKVEGSKAHASMRVLLLRAPTSDASQVRPEIVAGAHQLEIDLEKESEGWRVTGATRSEATFP